MQSRVDEAVKRYRSGFSCSQAVASAYSELLGLDEAAALRVSSGFGGGMGRLQDVCGALTGAFMLAGLRYGATRPEDKETKEHTYGVVHAMADRFKEMNGTIYCREILGCDISTPEGAKYAREQKLFAEKCTKCVEDAARLVEEMVLG